METFLWLTIFDTWLRIFKGLIVSTLLATGALIFITVIKLWIRLLEVITTFFKIILSKWDLILIVHFLNISDLSYLCKVEFVEGLIFLTLFQKLIHTFVQVFRSHEILNYTYAFQINFAMFTRALVLAMDQFPCSFCLCIRQLYFLLLVRRWGV